MAGVGDSLRLNPGWEVTQPGLCLGCALGGRAYGGSPAPEPIAPRSRVGQAERAWTERS